MFIVLATSANFATLQFLCSFAYMIMQPQFSSFFHNEEKIICVGLSQYALVMFYYALLCFIIQAALFYFALIGHIMCWVVTLSTSLSYFTLVCDVMRLIVIVQYAALACHIMRWFVLLRTGLFYYELVVLLCAGLSSYARLCLVCAGKSYYALVCHIIRWFVLLCLFCFSMRCFVLLCFTQNMPKQYTYCKTSMKMQTYRTFILIKNTNIKPITTLRG